MIIGITYILLYNMYNIHIRPHLTITQLTVKIFSFSFLSALSYLYKETLCRDMDKHKLLDMLSSLKLLNIYKIIKLLVNIL